MCVIAYREATGAQGMTKQSHGITVCLKAEIYADIKKGR